MQLVERHIINKNHELYKECDRLSWLSKNLYNQANYYIRQEFINNGKYLNYFDINKIMISEQNENYIALPRKVSNGTLRLLDKNWKSFFRSIKDWKKNKSKYLGMPKLPKYKDSIDGRFIVHYEKGAISTKELKNNKIKLSKSIIEFNTKINLDNLIATRIVPNKSHFILEVIYEKEIINQKLDTNNIIGIDLGVNNLMSCSTKNESFIINGKPLKSINQFYNKKISKMKSDNKKYSKNMLRMTNKRNNKVNDYVHKSTKHIINYCLTNNIGKLIIGNNKNWKQNSNLGKRNNQNFVNIPFASIINKLKYKCELFGIEFIETEESYTSKCSFIDNEEIKYHKEYVGERIKRGLFRSKSGYLINADINGSLNIIRKVVPLFNIKELNYGIEGVAVHPILIKTFY